jgi:hypothetical protein
MNDTEIVNDIEKIIDKFQQDFYASSNDDSKRMEASFYMGLIAGTLMRRGLKE